MLTILDKIFLEITTQTIYYCVPVHIIKLQQNRNRNDIRHKNVLLLNEILQH